VRTAQDDAVLILTILNGNSTCHTAPKSLVLLVFTVLALTMTLTRQGNTAELAALAAEEHERLLAAAAMRLGRLVSADF
jgi:hypothetical protein